MAAGGETTASDRMARFEGMLCPDSGGSVQIERLSCVSLRAAIHFALPESPGDPLWPLAGPARSALSCALAWMVLVEPRRQANRCGLAVCLVGADGVCVGTAIHAFSKEKKLSALEQIQSEVLDGSPRNDASKITGP